MLGLGLVLRIGLRCKMAKFAHGALGAFGAHGLLRAQRLWQLAVGRRPLWGAGGSWRPRTCGVGPLCSPLALP